MNIRAVNREIARAIKEKGIKGLEGHHNLSQELRNDRWAVHLPDVDIHDYVTYMDVRDHRLTPNGIHTGLNHWNKQWIKFFQEYPKATQDQIYEQLNKMMDWIVDLTKGK